MRDTTRQVARHYARRRRRLIAQGRWVGRQDPAPARAHIAELLRHGMSLGDIARACGLYRNSVWRIAAGRVAYLTPYGHHAILSVTPQAPRRLRSYLGAQRRARALARLGYTLTAQARLMGETRDNYWHAVNGVGQQAWSTHRADTQAALYDRLAYAPIPQGWVAKRCRRMAEAAGWASPAAWEGVDIDDPAATPLGVASGPVRVRAATAGDVDPVAVELACAGKRAWSRLTDPERAEVLATLARRRWPRHRIAEHLHVSGATVAAILDQPRQGAA